MINKMVDQLNRVLRNDFNRFNIQKFSNNIDLNFHIYFFHL